MQFAAMLCACGSKASMISNGGGGTCTVSTSICLFADVEGLEAAEGTPHAVHLAVVVEEDLQEEEEAEEEVEVEAEGM